MTQHIAQYIERTLRLPRLLKSKSFFLFGPRSTGKTTLLQHQLPQSRVYDLLDSRTFSRLLRQPNLIEEENPKLRHPIVIDEIQKLPILGEEINLETFAGDCGVSPMTVKNYIQILEDTLIGFTLKGFTKTKKRKATARIKHYLFDLGVVNTLAQRGEIKPKSELFGKAFEQFIIQELRAYLSYSRLPPSLSYWRSTSSFEVDVVAGNVLALEIKSTNQVNDKHLKGLRALKEEGLIKHFAVVSLDDELRTTRDGITIFPWQIFLTRLWNHKFLRA